MIETEQEKENLSTWFKFKSFRIVLLSIFTALSVVLGYLLISFPNIELFTLTIFLAGFIIGKKEGVVVGLFSSFIFVFFNPFGISPLPLLFYQVAHYSLVGLSGSFTSNFLHKKNFFNREDDLYSFPVMFLFGVIGATLTFVYDIISTLIGAVMFYSTPESFLVVFLFGLPFTIVHLIGNTLGFIFILPGLIQLIYKLLD